MRRFIWIIIPFFFIVITIVFYLYTQKNSSNNTDLPLHPYAISSLSNHVSANGKIGIEKKISSSKFFDSFLVSYYSEGNKIYALMNLPVSQKPESGWPVIIVNHGYIDPKIYSTITSYQNISAFYANQGFLVLKPDYRGNASSTGEIDTLFSRSQYAIDVLNLINAISSLPSANPQKIFIYGHSMGGDISLMVAENTDKIKGMSLWAPAVTTFPENMLYFSRRHNDNLRAAQSQSIVDELLRQFEPGIFSSFSNIDKINIPIIVQQSTTDESVPYSWGEALVTKLKENNKSVTFYSYQGDNHDIAKNFFTALSHDIRFFKSNF